MSGVLLRLFALAFMFAAGLQAHAGISTSNGVITIDVSGGDGYYSGDNGGNSGDVTLNLSYADAAKTQVKLDGQMIVGGKSTPIAQVIAVADLKSIKVLAVGGDGASGESGRDGSNGSDGSNGWDGCPPSNGYDGGNGSDGTNGGPGGNGGRGGKIHVVIAGDQSEILLLTTIRSSPGAGGAGGRGGSGGRGGYGGRGGRSNCTDSKGNPIPGPDGRDGSNGYNGRDGYSGSSGSGGQNGSQSYDVVDGGVTHTYPKPFALSISAVKTVDDNEDSILEPGEKLHVLQIQVSNTGPMPTPTGQALRILLPDSATVIGKAVPPLAITQVMAGGTAQVLNFPKGSVVMQGVDNTALIGKKAILNANLKINAIGLNSTQDTGFVFHWPIGVSAALDSTRAYFASAQNVGFTLHNISTKDVGPTSSQPADIEFSWSSKTVPGADVSVTLKDGRVLTLDKPVVLSDLTIPAKSNAPLPLALLAANSKKVLTANGVLKVTARVKDFSSPSQETVDVAQTSVFIAIDLRPVAINHHVDLSRTHCFYPGDPESSTGEHMVTGFDLIKAKGADKITIYYYREGMKSPAFTVDAFDFAIYTELIQSSDANLALGFLNNLLAGQTSKADVFWQFSGCYNL